MFCQTLDMFEIKPGKFITLRFSGFWEAVALLVAVGMELDDL